MGSMTTKIGYGNLSGVSSAITSGKIDERDLVVIKDTHELLFVDDNKNTFLIKSRLKIYNSTTEANTELNKDGTTYAGEPIIIKVKGAYYLYITQVDDDGKFYVQKISSDDTSDSIPVVTSVDWKDITNIPSTALVDTNTTYKLTQNTEDNTITLTGSDGVKYTVTINVPTSSVSDTNTTYTLTKVGKEIKLTDSDGAVTKVTDDNTTYTLEMQGTDLIFKGSDGTTKTIPFISYVNTNTTYSLVKNNGKIYLRDSNNTDSAYGIINSVATTNDIGYVKIGDNISIGTDGTISLNKTNVTNALGYTPPKVITSNTEPSGLSVGDRWVSFE